MHRLLYEIKVCIETIQRIKNLSSVDALIFLSHFNLNVIKLM